MWRGRLFFLCLALALLSGCAPGGPVAEAGADAQLPADKLIAITFDDGPRRNTTERLLDGLQERGASATFFLIGKQIEGNEDLVGGCRQRAIRWAATPGTMYGFRGSPGRRCSGR